MICRGKHLGVAVVAFAAVCFATLPSRHEGQVTERVSEMVGKTALGQLGARVWADLDVVLDMTIVQQPMSMKEALEFLISVVKKKTGEDLPILVDQAAFKESDGPDIYDTKVQFPPFPKSMTVNSALRYALSQVETKNATFVIKDDVIVVTTFERANTAYKLRDPIVANFTKRSLSDVLNDLAQKTGVSINIDQRIGNLADKTVTATFRGDMSLAGVLRVLTESASLKVVLINNGIFVTNAAGADALRTEVINRRAGHDPLWPPDLQDLPGGAAVAGLPGFPSAPVSQPNGR
jgi:hypothetical protein